MFLSTFHFLLKLPECKPGEPPCNTFQAFILGFHLLLMGLFFSQKKKLCSRQYQNNGVFLTHTIYNYILFSIFTWFFPLNQHIFLVILETSEGLANGYIFMCQEVCNVSRAASIWWIMAQTGAGTWKAGKFLDSKNTADVFRPVWISFRQNKGLAQYWLLHEKQITK